MPKYDGTILINTKIDDTGLKKDVRTLEKTLDDLYDKYDKISTDRKNGSFNADEAKSFYAELNKAIADYTARVDELNKKNELYKTAGGTVSQEDLMQAKQMSTYLGELQDMATDIDSFINAPEKVVETFTEANTQVEESVKSTNRWRNAVESVKATTAKIGASMGTLAKTVGSKVVSAYNKLTGAVKNFFKTEDKGTKSSIGKWLKYALGVGSVLALLNKIRSSVKESMGLLAEESEETKASMTGLKNAMTQLKHSTATILQPLLQAITPLLIQVIHWFTEAANAVASFIAVLTGQSYIYKAKEMNDEYADSANGVAKATKEATKALGGYDKLNVISKSSSGSGATGGTSGGSSWFEKSGVDSGVAKYIENIKNAFKNGGIVEAAAEAMAGAGKAILKALDNAFGTDLTGWFDSLSTQLANEFERLADAFANGALEGFATLGADLGKAILKGIDNAFGTDLTGFFDNMSTKLANFMYDMFGENNGHFLDNMGAFKIIDEGVQAGKSRKDIEKEVKAYIKSIGMTMDDFNRMYGEGWIDAKITEGAKYYIDLLKEYGKWLGKEYDLTQFYNYLAPENSPVLQGAKDITESLKEQQKQIEKNNKSAKEYLLTYTKIPASVVTKMDIKTAEALAKENGWKKELNTIPTKKTTSISATKDSKFDAAIGSAKTIIKTVPTTVQSSIYAKLGSTFNKTVKDARDIVTGKAVGNQGMPSYVETMLKAKDNTQPGVNAAKKTLSELYKDKELVINGKVVFDETAKKAYNDYALKWNRYIEGLIVAEPKRTNELMKQRLPMLANGAVIPANHEFLAVLGDQKHGTNIEAPLDTIVEAMTIALANKGNTGTVNLNLNGRQIAQAVWDENAKRYKQTGFAY